jgi:KUP system potassium uptake protein
MMFASVALVIGFRHSSGLAAAYGIAVTGTMAITTVLFYSVMHQRWGRWKTLTLTALFLCFDLAFLGANLAKIPQGGWISIGLASAIFLVMVTWRRGRLELREKARASLLPIEAFLDDVAQSKPVRVAGTAVFLSLNPDVAPAALLHNYKHNKIVHQQVLMLNIATERVPEVDAAHRVQMRDFGDGFYQVSARYGFMERPNVPEILRACVEQGIAIGSDTSYYLNRETLILTNKPWMAHWRKTLFLFLSRNAYSVADFFGIPVDRVVELGMQVEF